jgi:TetR/AcrR family transcriptional regulator, transcriptional repressor for nem operon
MSKAEQTRQHIVHEAARLFNRCGYAGTSMQDLMAVTGLKKGGIYNHFASKDELAIAAFAYAVQQVSQRQWQAVKAARGGELRLRAMVLAFINNFDEISAWGGCPLMNMAIDSDDTHPQLRVQAQLAMQTWYDLITRITQKAIDQGEFQANVEAAAVATIIISVLEGALALARLQGNSTPMTHAQTHLDEYIARLKLPPDSS